MTTSTQSAAVVSAHSFDDSLTASAPVQLLGWGQLPLPLRALVASHLKVDSLLRLQRCSSAHYRLRSNDAYMSVAWRWAKPWLDVTERLCEWTLSKQLCVLDDEIDVDSERRLIPVSMWQAALPVFRAVLAKAGDADERYQRLRELVRQPQHTKWVLAGSNAHKWWQIFSKSSKQSADVKQVEVLADIDWDYMQTVLHINGQVDMHCRLVLQACPYL